MHIWGFLSSEKRNQYGISAMVKQTVTLRATAKINDRIFDHSECFCCVKTNLVKNRGEKTI